MTEALLVTAIVLLIAVVVMLVFVLRRSTSTDLSPITAHLNTIEKSQERTERGVKEEIARNRQESAEQGRALREEVQGSLKSSTDSLVQSVDKISAAQQQRLEDFANQLNALTVAGDTSASQLRFEVGSALNVIKDSQEKRLSENALQLQQHFETGRGSDSAGVVWLARFQKGHCVEFVSTGRERQDRAARPTTCKAARDQGTLHQGF